MWSVYLSLKGRKHGDKLSSCSGIECVENKIQRARSRWFGHVEQKEENDWVKKCSRMNVVIEENMELCRERHGQEGGNGAELLCLEEHYWGPTRASTDARHTMCVCGHGC